MTRSVNIVDGSDKDAIGLIVDSKPTLKNEGPRVRRGEFQAASTIQWEIGGCHLESCASLKGEGSSDIPYTQGISKWGRKKLN